MAAIRLENIGKRYDNGVEAVHRLDLEIIDGEFLVLVGPSGCGKSSTLRMIAGLEECTSGDILINERRVNDIEPGKRDIAMVFQNYALYPHMTVRQNLSFGLKMRRTAAAEIKRRVADAANLLSIEDLLDRHPRQLSGGQSQRVAVGRAIVRKPAAFLFDEPLSNLDASLRLQMRKELAQLHQKLKTTTVYVTHDQVEAMTLGQRIAVMHQGRLQQIANPMELYAQPINQFVAGFIGNPAMNLLPGSLRGMNGEVQFHTGEIKYPIEISSKVAAEYPHGTLGFRPEHITLDSRHPCLAVVTIDLIERLGDESLIYFQLGSHPSTARLAGNVAARRGQELALYLPANQWHYFAESAPHLAVARGSEPPSLR